MIEINENTDGINHINAYSKGKTELGRLLSNFAHTPFIHYDLGQFESIEGYWYYITTGFMHENLRQLYGNDAKQLGKTLQKVYISSNKFERLIYEGLTAKFQHNKNILELCKNNNLPYYHYYVWPNIPIKLDESFWIKALRTTIQECILFE